MVQENQKEEIVNSLKTITTLLKKCNANYRILGSILIVAYSNKIFRHIVDVDILLDRKSKDYLFKELENEGFEIKKRNWLNFSWFEAHKPNHLGLTFLLIGDFEKDFFRYKVSKSLELRINSDYLKPTKYSFGGANFVGIPIQSAIAGIKQSFLNPKRKLDKEILGEETKKKVRVYNNINVYFKGAKLPYLYDVFSFFHNVYGATRTKLGFKYENW